MVVHYFCLDEKSRKLEIKQRRVIAKPAGYVETSTFN